MKALNGQNILDLSIQQAGSAEAAYDIAVLNGLSVSDDLTPGQELIMPGVYNKNIVKSLSDRSIKPATADTREVIETSRILFEELSLEFF